VWKKNLLWLMVHFSYKIYQTAQCHAPEDGYVPMIFINYLHKLYVCNQCFWLRGVCMGSAAGGNNEEARRYRNWCWSCIYKTQNMAFYWVMGSAHSMQELNTNRRDCLCMYVWMNGWIDGCVWVCIYLKTFIYFSRRTLCIWM
jgi:hypothetical protein